MDVYPLVLLANEPTAYRTLLAGELPFLRPDLRVLEINPADLNTAVTTFHTAVVICSRTIQNVCNGEAAVLVLYCEGDQLFLQSRDGTIVNPRLSNILEVIDRAVLSRNPASSVPQQERISSVQNA